MDTAVQWIGFIVFLVLIFGGHELLSAIRTYQRQKHIEALVAQLPEAERAGFVRDYLSRQREERTEHTELDEVSQWQ